MFNSMTIYTLLKVLLIFGENDPEISPSLILKFREKKKTFESKTV